MAGRERGVGIRGSRSSPGRRRTQESSVVSRKLHPVARSGSQGSRLNIWRVGFAAVILFAVFTLLTQFTSVLFSPVRSALPTFSPGQRTRFAVGLAQVAVLFFAGLVAVLQFIANSGKVGFESNSALVNISITSVICVLLSGVSATLSVFQVLSSVLFGASLFLMGSGFFLSTVIALIILVNLRPPANDDSTQGDLTEDSSTEGGSTGDDSTVIIHRQSQELRRPSSHRFRP